jgi:hypothetical protein
MVNPPTFVARARRSESRFHNDFAARLVYLQVEPLEALATCDKLRFAEFDRHRSVSLVPPSQHFGIPIMRQHGAP